MEQITDSLLTELRRGNLTLAVLSQLRMPQYGYSLVQLLDELRIHIEQITLYPLLRRLEKQKLLTSFWDTSGPRPRKYYEVTKEGEEEYQADKKEWLINQQKLAKVLREGEDEHEFD